MIKKNEMNFRTIVLLCTCAIFFTTYSCKDEKDIDCDVFEWSYDGAEGPSAWSSCHEDCGGQVQSPVNITNAQDDPTLVSVSRHYEDVGIHIINNGHTIEFSYHPGSYVIHQGIQYELLQFHFHASSEHSINGESFPLEVHFVHKDTSTGKLLVIGVFFEIGSENAAFESFINNLPDEEDEEFISAGPFNANWLLHTDPSYYTYEGSLTTPPCSEIVTWIVMEEPLEISAEHFERFAELYDHNNRPEQPLEGRVIRKHN